MLIDSQTGFDKIVSIARGTERKLLRDIDLFDVYQGEKLPAGKKSYAVSFTFLDEEQTLTDKQIDKTMERLIKAYQETNESVYTILKWLFETLKKKKESKKLEKIVIIVFYQNLGPQTSYYSIFLII